MRDDRTAETVPSSQANHPVSGIRHPASFFFFLILSPMRLIVLDGFTLNPGDLNWSPLAACAEHGFEVYDRTPPEEIVARARGAEIVLTNKAPLDRSTLEALRAVGLRYVGVLATGFNVVDVAAARTLGVMVTNVPAYGTKSVAQATFALLLELTNRVGAQARDVRAGRWSRAADWCFYDVAPVELDGLTLGLIGFGAIAQAVARLGQAFGMRVLTHRRDSARPAEVPGVSVVGLDEIFAASDVLSLHCPLTEETRGLVCIDRLAGMRRTAFLLNTARGALVVEPDLADALHAGCLAGAGLDVLSTEPPAADHPLLSAPNCVVTPHVAWASRAARTRLLQTAAGNVRAFLDGRPQNVVG